MLTARFILTLLILLGLASRGAAAPITWEFEGTVRYVDLQDSSDLGSSLGVTVGALASGRVVYESTTPDLVPGSGTFASAVTGYEVTIGSYEVGAIVPSVFSAFYVRLSAIDGTSDLEFADSFMTPDALFPNDLIATLSLIADTPGIIPDTSLPVAPPALADLRPFSIADWQAFGYGTGLQLYGSGPDKYVWVELTRLEAVPEPEMLALLGLASLAIALRLRHEC